ncbi:unnamed protein product [Sphagnum jensenii]|uniref:Uncharacterized protein n=1 Tax=Sphagnum jensenii TaxID=128206 RepID=A0ABP0VE77_9BRYO
MATDVSGNISISPTTSNQLLALEYVTTSSGTPGVLYQTGGAASTTGQFIVSANSNSNATYGLTTNSSLLSQSGTTLTAAADTNIYGINTVNIYGRNSSSGSGNVYVYGNNSGGGRAYIYGGNGSSDSKVIIIGNNSGSGTGELQFSGIANGMVAGSITMFGGNYTATTDYTQNTVSIYGSYFSPTGTTNLVAGQVIIQGGGYPGNAAINIINLGTSTAYPQTVTVYGLLNVTSLQTTGTLVSGYAVYANASGQLVASSTTSTQLSYLNTVTSNVQTQINNLAGGTTPITGQTPYAVLIANGSGNLTSSSILQDTTTAFKIYNTAGTPVAVSTLTPGTGRRQARPGCMPGHLH